MWKPKTIQRREPFTLLRSPATWRWCGCSWSTRLGGSREELFIDRELGAYKKRGSMQFRLGFCGVPGVSQERSSGVDEVVLSSEVGSH